jgi:hypothetical protein
MAKRSPRAQADDAAAAAPAEAQAKRGARPRGRRDTGTSAMSPEETAAPPSDTFAARTETDEQRPEDLGAPGSPNEDEIRLRAYHRYLERGGGHGMDFEDWLEAERELREGRKSEVGTRK